MKTQLLLALRILRRRKFFTFISLFGISFTIMALVVIAAMGDAALGDNPPLSKRDRLVFATVVHEQNIVPDTSYIVDSNEVNGAMVYDSTLQIGERQEGNTIFGLDYYLFDNHLRDLSEVESSSHSIPVGNVDIYIDGRKVVLNTNYTDANYWRILDFDFIEGQPYTQEQVAAGAYVVVLNDAAALAYFGEVSDGVIGQSITLGDDEYTVSGIVAKPQTNFLGVDSEAFIPVTTSDFVDRSPRYAGSGGAIFLAKSSSDRDKVVAELQRVAESLPMLPENDNNRFSVEGLTFLEEVADSFIYQGVDRDQAFAILAPIMGVLLLMLLLLPSLNLVNVNLSRAYERASEIAVRKSFGATDREILRQFMIETLLITVIGTLIGAILGIGLIHFINSEGWLGNVHLAFTPQVLLVTALLVLILTFLTGVSPALRLARTRIATSLR